MGPRN